MSHGACTAIQKYNRTRDKKKGKDWYDVPYPGQGICGASCLPGHETTACTTEAVLPHAQVVTSPLFQGGPPGPPRQWWREFGRRIM